MRDPDIAHSALAKRPAWTSIADQAVAVLRLTVLLGEISDVVGAEMSSGAEARQREAEVATSLASILSRL